MARTLMWIVGGILCATGILNLLFSFGAPYGDMSTGIAAAGFDGLGDVGPNDRFVVSVICLGLGLPTLVALNATAWKKTGGY